MMNSEHHRWHRCYWYITHLDWLT